MSDRSCVWARVADLVLGALGIEHSEKHLAVAISSGFVCLEYFAQSWGWGLRT